MRNLLTLTLPVILSLALVSCDDDDDTGNDSDTLITGEAYLTFEADGATVSFGPEEFDAAYWTEMGRTQLVGPEGGAAFMIQFDGAEPGSFTVTDTFVSYDLDPSQSFPWGWVASPAFEGSSFDLEIVSYEEVGGWITGTFSGTLVEMHESDPTGGTLSIANGEFALLRLEDR